MSEEQRNQLSEDKATTSRNRDQGSVTLKAGEKWERPWPTKHIRKIYFNVKSGRIIATALNYGRTINAGEEGGPASGGGGTYNYGYNITVKVEALSDSSFEYNIEWDN